MIRSKHKKIVIAFSILVLATLVFAGCTTTPEEKKIGKINIDKVIKESPKAQEIQNQLDKESERIRDKYNFDEEDQDLNEEEKKANQQKAIQEFVKVKQDLEKELNDKIETAIKGIAEEQNLDIVLYEQSVKYGGIDITQDVIEQLQ